MEDYVDSFAGPVKFTKIKPGYYLRAGTYKNKFEGLDFGRFPLI